MERKIFMITMSERCYRLNPEAIDAHAPMRSGIYEIVSFNENAEPTIHFVGIANPETIHAALQEHFLGDRAPSLKLLRESAKDIYFDFIETVDTKDTEEWKDVARALIVKHEPWFNDKSKLPSSGLHKWVEVIEADSAVPGPLKE